MSKDEWIKDEYLYLQKVVEDFDARALTIKGWSVTISMAGVGAGVLQSSAGVATLAALTAGLFWIIEGLWKSFQYSFYHRIRMIEAAQRDGANTTPLQIASAWSESFNKEPIRRILWIMTWPHVFLPHALILIVGLVVSAILAAE